MKKPYKPEVLVCAFQREIRGFAGVKCVLFRGEWVVSLWGGAKNILKYFIFSIAFTCER
jgi:hypothetical protein